MHLIPRVSKQTLPPRAGCPHGEFKLLQYHFHQAETLGDESLFTAGEVRDVDSRTSLAWWVFKVFYVVAIFRMLDVRMQPFY